MVSELFLIDAEQCNGALQRFAEGRRGQSMATAAEAAHALADVMGTLALAGDADCARRLARHLAQPAEAAQLVLLRGHAARLAQRLTEVVQALRDQSPLPDGTAFAAAWLAGLPPLAQAEGSPSAALPTPAAAPPTSAAMAALPVIESVVRVEGDDSEANQARAAESRRTLLAQARRLHDSLPSADAAMRSGLEPVIADLLGQICLPCRSPRLSSSAAPVLLSAESGESLAAALAVLPASAGCKARAQGGAVIVDVDLADPDDTLVAALLALLTPGGGWVARGAGGLRLSLPRDHHRPEVRVIQDAQGPFAVPALQAGAWAVLPAAAAAPTVKAWRYALPNRPAWPRPVDWLAMVSGTDGCLLPLRAPPAGVLP